MSRQLLLFVSYSDEDEPLRKKLDQHLKVLERTGVIKSWSSRSVAAGTEWERQIHENLNHADLILLLVSANFVASDYCYDIEMKRAMERHEKQEARVIPIILSPVDLKNSPFKILEALPQSGKPVTTWANQDEAWLDVATSIRRIAEEINGTAPGKLPVIQPKPPEVAAETPRPAPSRESASAKPQSAKLPGSVWVSIVLACALCLALGSKLFQTAERVPSAPDQTTAIPPGPTPLNPVNVEAPDLSSKLTSELRAVEPGPAPSREELTRSCPQACERLFSHCGIRRYQTCTSECMSNPEAATCIDNARDDCNELSRCVLPPTCTPSGQRSCGLTMQCLGHCTRQTSEGEFTDPACVCTCFRRASSQVTLKMLAMWTCAAPCISGKADDQKCMNECAQQLKQCQ